MSSVSLKKDAMVTVIGIDYAELRNAVHMSF